MAKSDNRSGVATAADTPIIPVATAPPAKPKRKARAPADPNETKRAKFVRLMKARMPKAEKAVLAVANLFRRNQYQCDEASLAGTVALLRKWVSQLEINFNGTDRPATLEMPFLTDTAPPNNGPAQ